MSSMVLDAQALGLVLGLATLGGLVWRMSALATKMSTTVDVLRGEVDELKSMRAHVAVIPRIERDIAQLHEVQSRLVSEFRELSERTAVETAIRSHSQGDYR